MRSVMLSMLVWTACGGALIGQDGKADPKKLQADLQAAISAQDWGKAVTVGRELTALQPENGSAWFQLGYALHAQGKLDDAIVAHKKAAEFKPTRTVGLYNLGCAYALKKEKDAAFEALEKAVAAGFRDAGQMEKDEDLAALREDDRYKQLVEKVKAMPKGRRALHLTGERKTTRLVFLGEGFRAAQQVAVAYGAPAWSAEYAKNIESGKLDGKRWRFGADFWTTFDSNADLTLNGKAIPAGMYYLALERTKEGGYVLAFLDAAEIRKMKIDPFAVGRTAGKGVEVPLNAEKAAGAVAETLEIAFEPDESDNSVGALTVRFGPYRLSAPYALKIDV